MIRQRLYIDKYDWNVYCYYAVDAYYVDEIAERLIEVGCNGTLLERAVRNMSSGTLNNGLTYSNLQTRESVMVIALTSNASQFLNSLVHELRHLINNICEVWGIEQDSEESCYLAGDVAQMMFGKVRRLMCDHCRRHI